MILGRPLEFFSFVEDFGKNKWKLRTQENKAMINSILEDGGGEGGQQRKAKFLRY